MGRITAQPASQTSRDTATSGARAVHPIVEISCSPVDALQVSASKSVVAAAKVVVALRA
ncbi:MAG: hypothetical protein RLO52_31715 [Sandaracinaceae bacterium]